MCFKGDLGTSFQKYPKKVVDVIAQAVPWTIALQLPTILFGWIVGNVLGALAAYRRGIFDKVFFPVALLISSLPFFVFGMLLVYYFSVILNWFPAMGGYAQDIVPSFSLEFLQSAAYYYVLPFFSIFLILAGGQAIGMRSMGIYELGTDYIKYAKWLGLKESKIIAYLFRNAMLPQLTGLALSLGSMISGALITEMIFSYPGLGMAILTAIQNNDYPMIQGCTLLITISVLIANFTVDILIGFLDPRVKAGLQIGKGN
jgi:peptide/nickel transport system permease protein